MSPNGRIVSLGVIAVLAALSVGGCPTPTPLPPGVTGDPVAGQADFDQMCAACHTPASLAGRQDVITNNLATVNIGKIGMTLTNQQVADLRAFLATQ